jgi:hypothetical protein
MNARHVDAHFKALSDKETKRFAEHLSVDIVLLSPVFPDPFEGKETVVKVLTGLLETVDSIRVELTFASGSDVAVFFSAGITVKGAEHIHVDKIGLIDRIGRHGGHSLPQCSSKKNSPIN